MCVCACMAVRVCVCVLARGCCHEQGTRVLRLQRFTNEERTVFSKKSVLEQGLSPLVRSCTVCDKGRHLVRDRDGEREWTQKDVKGGRMRLSQ